MTPVLILLTLCVFTSQLQEVVVNYNGDPYTALKNALGSNAIESPDGCDDFLTHITNVHDPILNRNVHHYTLHSHSGYSDRDRCGDKGRQRCETSVQPSSPAWMHGSAGKTFSFAWKLYLDPNFQVSKNFTHLHQIKLDGSGVGTPNLTLTAKTNVML